MSSQVCSFTALTMRKCDGGKADGNMKVALIDSGIRKDLLANACVIEDLVVEEWYFDRTRDGMRANYRKVHGFCGILQFADFSGR